MCIVCEFATHTGNSGGILPLDHASGGAPAPSNAGLVVGYTPPNPLPNFTSDQIVQALRTSWLGAADANGDYAQDTRTFSWNGPITYRLITTQTTITNTNGTATTADDTTTTRDNMSLHEQQRIAEAIEIWDDFINVNIDNNQNAGTAGNPTSFMDIFYVSGGTTSADGTQNGNTSGSAFAGSTAVTNRGFNNPYGTADVRIDNGQMSLGRNFNGGEFDGRVGNGGTADGGVDDLSYGQRGFETVLHEMGHALGLSHPGFYNNGLVTQANGQRFAQDTLRNTIMSYNSEVSATTNYWGVNASTPMVYDILAVHAMYGADPNTRTGSTTYGFANNSGRAAYDFRGNIGSVFTIYDAGGNDTLNASGYDSNSVINLWDGSYSSIGESRGNTGNAMLENVGIAFGTVIENAIGGSGNDTISGNWVGNRLEGNAGDDDLYGFDGEDLFYGGGGQDYFDGGNGNDMVSYQFDGGGAVDIDLTIGKTVEGNGEIDTYVNIEDATGTAFNDRIRGSDAGNLVYGYLGNDEIDGGAGNDILKGGGGDDLLRGGAGADSFYGDDSVADVGFDTVTYAGGTSFVTIDLLNQALNAGEALGDDLSSIEQVIGTAQNDTLNGNNDNNTFEGGAGADAYDGRGGNDTVSYASSSQGVAVDLSMGKYLYGDASGDTMVGIENFTGSAFDDDLRGDANANRLYGLAGNDDLYSFGGSDVLDGGAGDDTYYVSDNATYVYDTGGGYDRVIASATFALTSNNADIELMQTSDAAATTAINLYGSNHGNTLIGNAGNNRLESRGGNDFIYLGAGADVNDGGDGFDTMVFHKAMVADWQSGVLDADIGSDSWANWEAIQGSSGADRIRTNSWGYAVTLLGGDGHDVLATGVTGFVSDTLKGEGGNDELNGGAGLDRMEGGIGNDTYFVDNAGDVIIELAGQGYDTINTTLANANLGVAFERVNSIGPGNFIGTGNALDNRFQSLGGDDRFVDVLGGADIFSGGAGTDTVDFRTSATGVVLNFITNVHTGAADGDSYSSIEKYLGSNTAVDKMSAGGTGRVIYVGYGGDDRLNGGVKNDQLLGGDGNDILNGKADRDSLDGGRGNDIMTGGSDGDVFVYTDAAFGQDTITDYQDGLDSFKILSSVADNLSDFTITGNGTTSVRLTLASAPANYITVNGAAPITIAADDLLFY